MQATHSSAITKRTVLGLVSIKEAEASTQKRGGGLTPDRVASASSGSLGGSSYFCCRSASIRSVVAGWFAKKPPPLAPSVCMSQVSVAGMMSGDIPAFWRISMP